MTRITSGLLLIAGPPIGTLAPPGAEPRSPTQARPAGVPNWRGRRRRGRPVTRRRGGPERGRLQRVWRRPRGAVTGLSRLRGRGHRPHRGRAGARRDRAPCGRAPSRAAALAARAAAERVAWVGDVVLQAVARGEPNPVLPHLARPRPVGPLTEGALAQAAGGVRFALGELLADRGLLRVTWVIACCSPSRSARTSARSPSSRARSRAPLEDVPEPRSSACRALVRWMRSTAWGPSRVRVAGGARVAPRAAVRSARAGWPA